MPRSLHIAILLFFSICAYSQPTITADWIGQPGETIGTAESSSIPDISAKGENVTWDFSDIVEIDTTRFPFQYVQADTTPFIDDYPNANQCLFATETDPEAGTISAYQYFEATDTEWSLQGTAVGNSFGAIKVDYTDPLQLMQFPMTYETAFSDFYGGVQDLVVATTQFIGLSIYEADAYGTLILPNGTFENCLRIARTSSQTDTTDLGLGIIELVITDSKSYTWYSPDYPGPLAIYEESEFYSIAILDPLPPDTSETFFDTTFTFDPTAVISNIEEVDLESFAILTSPNPFTDAFVLNFDLDSPEEVTIELYGMHGQLYYQQLVDGYQGTNTQTISGNQLPSGMYTVVLRSGKKIASQRVVKLE